MYFLCLFLLDVTEQAFNPEEINVAGGLLF